MALFAKRFKLHLIKGFFEFSKKHYLKNVSFLVFLFPTGLVCALKVNLGLSQYTFGNIFTKMYFQNPTFKNKFKLLNKIKTIFFNIIKITSWKTVYKIVYIEFNKNVEKYIRIICHTPNSIIWHQTPIEVRDLKRTKEIDQANHASCNDQIHWIIELFKTQISNISKKL